MAYEYKRTNWIDEDEENNIRGTDVIASKMNNIEDAIYNIGNSVVSLDNKRSIFLSKLGNIEDLNNSNPNDIVSSAKESIDIIDSLKTEKQTDLSIDFDKFHHIYKTQLSELKNVTIKGDTRINYIISQDIRLNYFIREGYNVKPDIINYENFIFVNIPNTSVLENSNFSIGQKFMESYLYPNNEYYLSFILLISKDTDIDVEISIGAIVDPKMIKLKSGYYNIKLKTHDEITSDKDLKSEIKLNIKSPISNIQILLMNPKLNRFDGLEETYFTGINSVRDINITSYNSNIINKQKTLPTTLINNTPFFTTNNELLEISNDITVNGDRLNYGCGWFVNVEPDSNYEIQIDLSQLPYYKILDLNILSSTRDLYNNKIYEITKDNILWCPTLLMNDDAVIKIEDYTDRYGNELYYSLDWNNGNFNMAQSTNNFANVSSEDIKLDNLFAEDDYTQDDLIIDRQLYYESYKNVKYINAKIHTGKDDRFLIISLNAITNRQNFIENDKFVINNINFKNIDIQNNDEYTSYSLNIDLKGEELNRINDEIYDSIEYYGGRNVILKHTSRCILKSSLSWKLEKEDEENNKFLFSVFRPFNKEDVLSFNYNECIFLKGCIRDIYYNKIEDKLYIETNKTHVIYDLQSFIDFIGEGIELIYPINEKIIELDIEDLNINTFHDVTNINAEFNINENRLSPYVKGTIQLTSENMMKDISNRIYKLNCRYNKIMDMIESIKIMNKEIESKIQTCNNLM